MHGLFGRVRRTVVRCTLCGREIAMGEDYWTCNGTLACAACFPEFAGEELSGCRTRRGEEAEE